MNTRDFAAWLRGSILLAGALGAASAGGQEVVQALDQVKAYGANDVLDMTFHDPYRDENYTPPDYTTPQPPATPITSASDFVACKQTSAAGLICLTVDEKIVNWSDPVDGRSRAELFSCDDVTELLDVRASNTCTSVTADEIGAIWLAGKNKGKSHSLVRVTSGACDKEPTPRQTFISSSPSGGTYCASEWDTGRPLLLSVKRVEGQVATRFNVPGDTDPNDGDTVLGLEQRLNAVIFNAKNQNDFYDIPGGKSGWNLGRKEELQDIALLQAERGGGYDNYVLVTTTDGRVMAKDMANPSAVAYAVRSASDRTCGTAGTTLSLAASPKGKIIYLSDSACASVVALEATRSGGKLVLVPAKERVVDDSMVPPVTSLEPVPTLQTGDYSPIGITVAPGQDFQLAQCSGDEGEACSKVPGFKLWNLDFIDGVAVDSGVTVLQILNIPDCRWTSDDACVPGAIWVPEGIALGDRDEPSVQYLDVEKLLPQDVWDVLEAKDVELPGRLLISPQHRAQKRNDFRFDAFFFVVDNTVRFTGIFDGEFEMEKLIGKESLCANTIGRPSVVNGADENGEHGIIGADWDMVSKIADQFQYVSVDGLFQDVLQNSGCGSSRVKPISLSMYNFPLEMNPDSYLGPGKVVKNNDAVFARYMLKLYYDLDYVARYYACNLSDAADGYPASDLLCGTLLSNLTNAGDKLGKCIDATYQPKQSAGNQNCTSFLQQWASVKASIDAIVMADKDRDDPANRRSELKQRTLVFDHVYDTRFWPSVPDGGFCREAYVLAGGTSEYGCPAP